MSTGNWGADTTNESKPQWPIVQEHTTNGASDVVATEKGWVKKYAWGGSEVLVAISNLNTKLGLPNVADVYVVTTGVLDNTAPLSNTTGQALELILSFNEAVTVTDGHLPTISLICNSAAANVTLTYNVADSDTTTGKLIFRNDNFSLAHADYVPSKLVLNSSCTLTHFDNIYDAGTNAAANVVANTIPASVSKTFYVYQATPIHTNTTRVGTAVDTANQFVSFAIKFNEPITLSGATPTIVAQATTEVTANLVLTYTATGSNLALGNLVFVSTAQNFSALTQNGVFTANSTNTPGNWASIHNAIGGHPVNGIVVANTFTVLKCEPVTTGVARVANVTNAATQTVSYALKFDRPVVVTAPNPTIVAISNTGSGNNLTLTYASGSLSNNVVFSSAVIDMTAYANQYWTVNATSVIANFTNISNTGVGCDATTIGAYAANLNVVTV